MATTLAELAINSQDKLKQGFINELITDSYILNMMPFDDCLSANGTSDLVYAYKRVETGASAAFRSLNEEPKASEVKIKRVTTKPGILSSKWEMDRVAKTAAEDLYELKVAESKNAIIRKFNATLIAGDTATEEKGFDGLAKALKDSSTEFTSAVDLTALDKPTALAFATEMDTLLASLTRDPRAGLGRGGPAAGHRARLQLLRGRLPRDDGRGGLRGRPARRARGGVVGPVAGRRPRAHRGPRQDGGVLGGRRRRQHGAKARLLHGRQGAPGVRRRRVLPHGRGGDPALARRHGRAQEGAVAMSLLYPDTVTVYNRLGGEGRAVSWQRTVLTEAARVFDPIGTVRAPGGDRPAAVATAVIAPAGYTAPADFAPGSAGWTLRPRDMVALGAQTSPEPPKGALTVSVAEAIRMGASVDHVEAEF